MKRYVFYNKTAVTNMMLNYFPFYFRLRSRPTKTTAGSVPEIVNVMWF